MKKKFVIILGLALSLFALVVCVDRSPLRGEDFSHEFEKLALEGKQQKILNLNDFKVGLWDDMVVWFPYSRIGEYKIRSSFWQDEDRINGNDRDNLIIFLKHNVVVGWAEFMRVDLDFTYLEIGTNRIPRERAKFGFNEEEKFTKVFLLNESKTK